MSNFLVFDSFIDYVGKKKVDLSADTLKMMLTNVAPVQGTSEKKADLTEIAAGNGYVAGGVALTGVSFAETGAGTGIWMLDATDPAITAVGGSIATARYAVIYDDTHADDPLIGFADYGTTFVIEDTKTFTMLLPTTGLLRITRSP